MTTDRTIIAVQLDKPALTDMAAVAAYEARSAERLPVHILVAKGRC